jgi:hypothetical protein
MSHWGYGLLAAYVVLGLSAARWRKAGRLAAVLTVGGLAYAFHSYGAI